VRNLDFFEEIEHREVPWGEKTICIPVFYYDAMTMEALFAATLTKLQAWMPSPRMRPLRLTPWHGMISISAMEYRDSDIGPYNEVSISVPFTLDRPSPILTGILRKAPEEPRAFIRHLPVTTEIARDLGVEFAGYPKILASIEFEREADRVTCHVVEDNQHILTFSGRQLETHQAPRVRMHVFTSRKGRLLRSELILSERQQAASKKAAHAQLELGDHPIAQELKALNLGRMLAYQYTPQYQSILTPVIESFAL
jgi:hypothetical protein